MGTFLNKQTQKPLQDPCSMQYCSAFMRDAIILFEKCPP